jgi:hypothetical protein
MKTVAFFGSCAARSSLVLVSPRISTPFTFKRFHCKFESGCQNLLSLRFYYSSDDQAPSSGAPSGLSVLREYGQVDYVVGDGDSKHLEHEVEVKEGGSYFKVYAVNDDFYAHDVDVQMEIEISERR